MVLIVHAKTRILVDADACPVKQEIVIAAHRFATPVIMVASYAHRLMPEEGVEIVQVDPSDQAVDLYIANHMRPGDIVITQDFGVAALALGRGALAMSFRGQQYTADNIDFLLATRHARSRARRGGLRTKGPRAMTDSDREIFLHQLTKVLRSRQENESV